MVDSNKEKVENQVESVENNNDVESTELLEEAKVYLAEEEVAEAKEFIREEEIKSDGKLLHYTKVILSGALDQIFAIALAFSSSLLFKRAFCSLITLSNCSGVTHNLLYAESFFTSSCNSSKFFRFSL